MKKKYRVISLNENEQRKYNENIDLLYARELKEQFGLPHDLLTIYHLWTEYSESYCAGWLFPEKESVENIFGVTLEEIPVKVQ